MLKKTTLAVIGLAASSFASAGSMGPVCTPGNVTVPCEAERWDLGVQALYFKSLYGANKSVQPVLPNNFQEISNEWHWGGRLEGSYHFNTGNDLTIDWIHYKISDDLGPFLGEFPLIATNGPTNVERAYSVSNKNHFDQINAVLGQHADFGLVKKMRFYGGMQYGNVQTRMKKSSAEVIIPRITTTSVDYFANADFKGFGPVLGIDYSYNITNELSVTANGQGSLLYGTTRYNAGFVAQPAGGVFSSVYSAKNAIVPTMQAKLGMNYAYSIAQGVMNFEAGYQVLDYFNVFQTQAGQVIANPLLTSDFGLYGPYFGVKYVGNA